LIKNHLVLQVGGGGVDAAGQPPAHLKKKIAKKKPIGNIIIKWAQEDVETLYNLLNNNNS